VAFDGARRVREDRDFVSGRYVAFVSLIGLGAGGCWLTSSFDDLHTEADAGVIADANANDGSESDASTTCLASSYVASVMADAPVAYYRLDETSGTTAKDSSGTNDAHYQGGVTLGVAGVLGDDSAASFDGTTGWVSGSGSPSFLGKSPFTLEAWVKPSKVDVVFRGVISNESSTTSDKGGYTLWAQSSDGGANSIGFERWQSGKSNLATASPLTVGAWTHLVATFDGNRLSIYVNGAMIAQSTSTPVAIASGFTFAIGALNSGAQPTFFAGAIDEVAIYDHVVSATCIGAHYRLAMP
jgi:hypothetical protein